ncbi:NUDIX domain-containing protein [Ornithinimicrobium sp. F0845]|uniref:NUDIX hydrolase n=1 Tax=Ornithinimicrobium sp. F0845 TaxID=2926412 RepID=UPI001FF46DE9|nr:NUDIX domain-containing protein [Ornithinimicrobium sp. F0845]MCK0112872.1 NUDIX domain-containing protein [Ornithinimicrobium sp. F0845]
MDLSVLRRKVGTAALVGFRRIPGPLKRTLVRAGTPSYTVGAVCLVEHDGEVLLLWQPHRLGWSLPGGLLGRGEEPEDAVRREVREEVGLDIEPGDPIAVGVHASTQQIDVIYRVRVAERPQVALATEARKARWWSPAELTETDHETRRILELAGSVDHEPAPGRLVEEAS